MADTDTIDANIEGRSIRQLRLDELKRRLYGAGKNGREFRRRFTHLERIDSLPMPGPPDEAWRRIDFSSFPLDDLTIASAELAAHGVDGSDLPNGVAAHPSGSNAHSTFHRRYADLSSRRSGRIRDRANDVRANRLKSINEALATRPLVLRIDGRPSDPVIVTVRATASRGTRQTGSLSLPQLLIHGGAGSSANIVLAFVGSDTTIARTKIVLESNSDLRITTVAIGGTRFHHDSALLDAGARLRSGYVTANCDPAMIEAVATLAGERAQAAVSGLAVGGADRFSGQKLSVDHLAPRTVSDTRWHSVLRDTARSLFVGNITIPQGARASRGTEQSHALLLSESARAESIPQLEIIENDVECSHGATVAGPDPDTVYYLQSRGIPRDRVEALLASAFCRQIIDPLDLPTEVLTILKEAISHEVEITNDN